MIIRRQLYPNNKVAMKKSNDSAAAGTNIVNDVDALLTPIHQHKHREDTISQSQSSKERTERNLWRNDEVMEMLYTMQQVKALEKLNDKTVKSENVFKDVEVIMHRNGFKKKSHVQIWTKWKFLKSTYMTSRRNGIIPRMIPPQVYETIHQMITGLNQSLADSCNSTNCSIDGDTSSVSGMVISGVEGGVSDVGVINGDDEDSFGMAHPIFGFRLGMVKSEPADTGYEAVGNNGSDKDPLEELSPSKSDKHVKEEQSHTETAKTIKAPEPVQKVIEVPHRGRGRPPKHPPAATSTPNNTPPAKNAQMPPLRVAPFAKAINSTNAITGNRPPPPLTMPPTPRIRIANLSDLKNGDSVKFVQPKLMPKPTNQQQSSPVQPIRLSKEITIQSRASSTPSPSYPKMKQIPMRKTPYSLRPDRAIPDLEASLSPPPPTMEKPSNKKLEEVPTTKHLTMQSNPNNLHNNVNRKRRTEWQDPLPGKQAKYNNNMEDEETVYKSHNMDDGKHYGKVLQNVIIDLSASLRKMQTQMMRDFFNKQNELLEREHRFQLQQDRMIMKAFQQQTQEIMHSVKQLVGSIKSCKSDQRNEQCETHTVDKTNGKIRAPLKHAQMQQEIIEEDLIQTNEDVDDNDNGEDDEEQQDEQQVEQEADEDYTDGEEQQDQMEEQGENEQEENEEDEVENNTEEEDDNEQHDDDNEQSQSQSNDEPNENGLAEGDDDDDDSNESDVPDHDSIRMGASELHEN